MHCNVPTDKYIEISEHKEGSANEVISTLEDRRSREDFFQLFKFIIKQVNMNGLYFNTNNGTSQELYLYAKSVSSYHVVFVLGRRGCAPTRGRPTATRGPFPFRCRAIFTRGHFAVGRGQRLLENNTNRNFNFMEQTVGLFKFLRKFNFCNYPFNRY